MSDYLYQALSRLIAFNTVSSTSDAAAIEYLTGELEPRGFNVAEHAMTIRATRQKNLVAWAGPPRPDGLIISGHVDTVPFVGQPGWERDPLEMEVAAGRIFGRGTSDMKGFIAECLEAARTLDLKRLARPLVFVFTASEEVGCLGAAGVAPELARILGETPVPRLAWIGEPSSWQVFHAHKSIVSFEVRVHGCGGHSGAPEQGVNAIAVMAKVIDAIGRYQAERRAAPNPKFAPIFPGNAYEVLNFGTVTGGIASNVIAEQSMLKVSYRSLPGSDPLEVYRDIERRLGQIEPRDFGSDLRAEIELRPPQEVVPSLLSPRGTALEKTLFAVTGAATAGGALYATDGGWFAHSGIVSLISGPGDIEQAHRPNENIRRDAFERGPGIIREVIERMCCAAS